MAAQDPSQRGNGTRMVPGLLQLSERIPDGLDHIAGMRVIS